MMHRARGQAASHSIPSSTTRTLVIQIIRLISFRSRTATSFAFIGISVQNKPMATKQGESFLFFFTLQAMRSRYIVLWAASLWLSSVVSYAPPTAFLPRSIIERNSIRHRRPRLLSTAEDKTLESENSSTVVKHSKKKLLDDLARDFARLSEARPPIPTADDSMSPVLVSAGSSYTRLWTHSTWQSHSRPPHIRYARHVLRWWSSSTARVILPAVLIATTYATVLCVVCRHFGWTGTVLTGLGSTSVLSILSAPLALLLTLRANASMTRLLESRLQFGRMVSGFEKELISVNCFRIILPFE